MGGSQHLSIPRTINRFGSIRRALQHILPRALSVQPNRYLGLFQPIVITPARLGGPVMLVNPQSIGQGCLLYTSDAADE